MAIDRDDVLRLFAYHHWAEDLLLDAFAPVTAAQLDAPWGGSFGTGRALLRHVVGADRVWTMRWHGTSLPSIPEYPTTWAGVDFRREWERVKAGQLAFLAALGDEPLDRPFSYVNLKGQPWSYPLGETLLHAVNHGTYHRGQLAHLLRDLGVGAPTTDYLVFVETRRGA